MNRRAHDGDQMEIKIKINKREVVTSHTMLKVSRSNYIEEISGYENVMQIDVRKETKHLLKTLLRSRECLSS